MRSAALAEVARRGAKPFPALAVDFVARGYSLGREVYANEMRLTALGQVTRTTKPGSWSPITYGPGIDGNTALKPVTASVDIVDPRGELAELIETYNPRGSVARMDWGAAGMVEADYEPLFRGVLADYARLGDQWTRVILKTDDTVLRSPVPSATFQRAQWGSAGEPSIFGTHYPLVTGIHDSWSTTMRGACVALNVRYDKDLGYWWLASGDQLLDVDRIYYDGAPQGDAGWSVLRGVFGTSRCTIIVVAEGYQPSKGVVVSFDCSGPNEDGLATGSPLTGAPDILRAIINNYAYRLAPLTGWRGDHPILSTDHWDAASEYFALHHVEAARVFGHEQKPETVADVLQSFADSLGARLWWTPLGQIAIGVIDPDDEDPPDEYLDLALHHPGGEEGAEGRVPFAPGDAREVYTHVPMQFMWSPAEQKFLSEYQAHDVSVLEERVVYPAIPNVWSQCRLLQSTAINPAPPADPVP